MKERQIFLKSLIGTDKIKKIENQISSYGGRVCNGEYGNDLDNITQDLFGQFDVRLVGVSKGIRRLQPNITTAIGGWCALRTADVNKLKEYGSVSDPLTGESKAITSINTMNDWLEQAVSIDQIIEAVGLFKGNKYVAISEVKLWADRIRLELSNRLNRPLTKKETNQIENSLRIAELKRFVYTQRYLNYANKCENSIVRVEDRDIWDDLVQIRDEMLRTIGSNVITLINGFPDEEKNIPGYSIVWGMYTGLYLNLLKSRGLVSTTNGLIIEPSFHAIGETKAKAYVSDKIFNEENNYLVRGGINENLAFAAYAELMFPNGDRMSRRYTIDQIPNPLNYRIFISDLIDNPDRTSLTLTENPVFVWGINLFPYGKTRIALQKMIEIRNAYKDARKYLGGYLYSKEDSSKKALELKIEFGQQMNEQALTVISELQLMFESVFK